MRKLLLFFVLISAYAIGQIDHWETAVYEDDNWRYLVPSSPVSVNWTDIAFNDASWTNSPGGFGYGDGDDNTTFPATISCYQRFTFNITDANAIDLAVLNIDYDDAFVAYLNGIEITRDNITSVGQPVYSQSSDGLHEAQMYSGGNPSQFILSNAFVTSNLINGVNVLSIQTHNESLTSSDMSSRVWFSLGINNTSSDYGITPPWFNPPTVFTDSNLPIVVINTVGGVTIPNEPKVDATMGIIYNGPGNRNYLTDSFNEYNGDIGIETRGSSSQSFPKKQFGLETRDPSGNRHDVTIFNMAFDNDWVLFAPYSDKSLIRNILAYQMGWDTDRFAPRTKLCEVVINGSYEGVYIFTEKIKRKDGKVGSNDLETQDVSGNEVTGDYIIKVDKFTAGGVLAWASPHPPYTGATSAIRYQAHDPGIDSLVPAQLAYIENYVTNFENALFGVNFTDPIVGYRPYIDVESFIDFMLVNEISKNVDGYRISTFFHKLRTSEGGKFAAGPLWDFNLAFGNANYCQGGNTNGWELDFYLNCPGDGYQNPYYWKRMTEDSDFTHRLNCRYTEMRQGIWHTDSLMARIDTLSAYLDESQQRNFQRWQTLGTYVWPNNFIGNTYAEEINYLKTWLTDRLTWMDNNMFGSCPDLGLKENQPLELKVFPNPASDFADIYSKESFNSAIIQLSDGTGKIVYQSSPQIGNHISLDLRKFGSGLYLYNIIENGMAIDNGKLSIIK